MKKEWTIFLTSLMYFTRIRVPKDLDHRPANLQKAIKYFPLIGLVVGAVCSVVFLIFATLISVDFGILASMAAGLLITGAFHEDGLADVCDGFGGGWNKEKILQIMKDSRIGAFGALGLMAMLAGKFLLLSQIAGTGAALSLYVSDIFISGSFSTASSVFARYHDLILALIAAHAFSRLMPILVIQTSANVADAEQSKSKPLTSGRLSPGELVIAMLLALIPFLFLSWHFLLVIPAVLLGTFVLTKYFTHWIGGYTGDCLGAIQQVSEILIYLGFILIRKHYA